MRILALDIGDRHIGVAVSDPTGIIATPVATIDRDTEPNDIESILSLVNYHNVDGIVIGLPLTLAGHFGSQARRVEKFKNKLAALTTIKIKSVDERYSTVEAEKMLRETRSQPSKNRPTVDAAAACVILQGYLNSLRLT